MQLHQSTLGSPPSVQAVYLTSASAFLFRNLKTISNTRWKDMHGKKITNTKPSFLSLEAGEPHLVCVSWYLVGL